MEGTAARNYDISELRADGSHYAAVGFELPYCLHLPYDHYAVRMDIGGRTITVQVQLESHRRSESRKGGFLIPPEKAEKFADRLGTYRYSSVVVYIPIRSSDPEIHGSRDRMWRFVETRHQWIVEQGVRAVNRLVSTYRFSTAECHIRPLSGRDLWFDHSLALVFIDYDPSVSTSKATATHVPYYYDGDIVPQILPVPAEVQNEIRTRLTSEFQVPLWEELLLNTYDLVDRGNYRLAVIEAETAFEAALWAFVRDYHRSKGEPDQSIDARFTSWPRSFTAVVREHFAEAFDARSKQFCRGDRYYDTWHQKVWELRGGLVHGRLPDASLEEATEALQTIEDTLEYLIDRPKTRPWRYVTYSTIDLTSG